jgi:hypothetical protein
LSGDFLVGSGLRADETLPDGSTIPNGYHLPYYEQINLSLSHDFSHEGVKGLKETRNSLRTYARPDPVRGFAD